MKYTLAIRGKYKQWIVPIPEDTAKGMLADGLDVQGVHISMPDILRTIMSVEEWERIIRWLGGD